MKIVRLHWVHEQEFETLIAKRYQDTLLNQRYQSFEEIRKWTDEMVNMNE